jgi:hypothetical protein
VTVRAADLDGVLYRVETPPDGRHVPGVTDSDGVVQVQLAESGRNGPSAVTVTLAAATRWRVRLVAGSTQQTVDLSAGRVVGVEFVGGVTSIELTLPRPAGTVPVRMTGGVGTWAVHLPTGVPARILVGGGAGSATLDGTVRTGISGGTTLTGDGWDAATDRYDITAAGGMSSFTLDHR